MGDERGEKREEIYPLRYNVLKKKNEPNITVRTVRLERKPCSFHMLPNVAKGFRTYAKFTGKTVAECVEEALLEYMKNHPTTQTSITIVKSLESTFPDYRSRLSLKLLKQDLRDSIDLFQKTVERKVPGIYDARERLKKNIRKALKIKNPDQELIGLLKQAEDLL